MPPINFLGLIISSLLGFLSGFISSYIFWFKQRQLDKPRLVLDFDSKSFFVKNKGGSFAEKVKYSYGYFHPIGEEDVNYEVSLDDAVAPDEKIYLGIKLEDRDAVVSLYYQDVFGRKYHDSWQVGYIPNSENDFILAKLDS